MTLTWTDASYKTDRGVQVTAWAFRGGRFRIEQHPQTAGIFLLTDFGTFAGIYPALSQAQQKAGAL